MRAAQGLGLGQDRTTAEDDGALSNEQRLEAFNGRRKILNKNGKIIGIEILGASKYPRKLIQQQLEPQLRRRMVS